MRYDRTKARLAVFGQKRVSVVELGGLAPPLLHVVDLEPLMSSEEGGTVDGGASARIADSREKVGGPFYVSSRLPIFLDDLVQDVAFMDGSSEAGGAQQERMVVGFSHNNIQVWDWSGGVCLYSARCVDPCILYSMTLEVEAHTVVVFAGTVYNQVLVWTADTTTAAAGTTARADQTVRPIIQKLCGHEGVLFKMSVHREAGLVASVSDDRSVRLWRLRTDSGATKEGGVVPRSSSFVRSIVGLAEGSDCDSTDRLGFHQEWAAWGHQARIWDVEFVRGRPSGGGGAEEPAPLPCNLRVVTVGEDSQGLVWNMHGECVAKFVGHTGRHVWSVAVDDTANIIATGGGDSNAKLWRMQETARGSVAAVVTLQGARVDVCDNTIALSVVSGRGHKVPHGTAWDVKFELPLPSAAELALVPTAAGDKLGTEDGGADEDVVPPPKQKWKPDDGGPPATSSQKPKQPKAKGGGKKAAAKDDGCRMVALSRDGKAAFVLFRASVWEVALQSGEWVELFQFANAANPSDANTTKAAGGTKPKSLPCSLIVLEREASGGIDAGPSDDASSSSSSGATVATTSVRFLVLGYSDGWIHLYKTTTTVAAIAVHTGTHAQRVHTWHAHRARVNSLMPVSVGGGDSGDGGSNNDDDGDVFHFISSSAGGQAKWWEVHARELVVDAQAEATPALSLLLPPGLGLFAHFQIPSKSSVSCCCTNADNSVLFCGDGRGTVFAFAVPRNTGGSRSVPTGNDDATTVVTPAASLRQV
jgi:hypothetical protein